MSTATIEATDTDTRTDEPTVCDVMKAVSGRRCTRLAVLIVSVRHCDPYRLNMCVECFTGDDWICRKCAGRFNGFGNMTVVGKVNQ